MAGYPFEAIESKWQTFWLERKTFRTPDDVDTSRPKFYVLDMFPYPSGVGLHVGHPLGYIATDIVARYKRMRGFNVLHPIGFDAFGLPAEQFAVEHGVHPRVTTEKNIANMVRQLKRLGLSYDWDRVLATIDVGYYRWTQWIFLQLYNSYVDPATQQARPIDDLVRALENGDLLAGPGRTLVPASQRESTPEARPWSALSEAERHAFLAAHRLAYMDEIPVNWCPALGTVLANEEVTNDGRSERGNHPVYKRPLRQWMLRITAYAERLGDDLERVDWPEAIKIMQRNWIGRSEGAEADFAVVGRDDRIRVFTTRPDTLFGATYMVLAPEHPLVDALTTDAQRAAVDAYKKEAERQSEIDRMAESKVKTGVFTGAYAVNPVNGEEIPIWIADYVLMGYGTGAIMAVPGHDQRDFDFARQFGLPVRPVVHPDEAWLHAHDLTSEYYLTHPTSVPEVFSGHGTAIHSTNDEISLDGLPTPKAKKAITDWLAEKGLGAHKVRYKLRDWLFSRQRYWGEPFPILHGPDGAIVAVDAADLPVALPPMDDFSPEAGDDPNAPPRPPLSRADASWRTVTRDGVRYERELNTMPQWAGSCWYYLRFIDPGNDERLVDPDRERYWMGGGGVDLYVGGAEHAVLHLLYARFWHKALYDLGYVSTPEPFGRLFNQGYIQAYAYRDRRGIVVPADEVVDQDGRPAQEVQDQPNRTFYFQGEPVTQEYGKMGKSLKNAVNPDDICEQYGCDTLRLYEMYMGPLEASKPWNTRDIVGVNRFLRRIWRNFVDEFTDDLLVDEAAATEDQLRLLHKTIERVTDNLDRLSFNTATAALIEMNNELVGMERIPRALAEPFVLMLAPLAPHMAEELWQHMGHADSLAYAPWPEAEAAYLRDDQLEIAVQVNGKVRASIRVPADADKEAVLAAARGQENVARYLDGKTMRREIYVPGRIVNLVVG